MENIILIVFVLGYLFITLEHKTKINKSAIALSMGGLLWVILALSGQKHVEEELMVTSAEIFEIVIFLLVSMSLVEILVHYQLFDLLKNKVCSLGLRSKNQFVLMIVMTFIFSSVINNLTITIISVQIARSLFKGKNLIIVVSGIIIAANAGGVFSPIGDVTTIMLWLAGKLEPIGIMLNGFLPSLALIIATTLMLKSKIVDEECNVQQFRSLKLSKSEKIVISLTLLCFLLPVAMNFLGLPPYLGLLIGLGFVWLVIDLFKQKSERVTHLEASIDEMLKKTDISSLKFFIGILLAVSALSSGGILEGLTSLIYKSSSNYDVIVGNIILGPISAVLDNVPLTAIAIKTVVNPVPAIWSLLAITVGVGGSFLVIGSAAGIIAMGLVEELNFKNYFQIAFLPMLVGYILAVIVWGIQFLTFYS